MYLDMNGGAVDCRRFDVTLGPSLLRGLSCSNARAWHGMELFEMKRDRVLARVEFGSYEDK